MRKMTQEELLTAFHKEEPKMEQDLKTLEDASKKLASLFNDSHPGLMTWLWAVQEQVKRIDKVYHSSGMDKV